MFTSHFLVFLSFTFEASVNINLFSHSNILHNIKTAKVYDINHVVKIQCFPRKPLVLHSCGCYLGMSHLNIVADQTHPIMATALPQQDGEPHHTFKEAAQGKCQKAHYIELACKLPRSQSPMFVGQHVRALLYRCISVRVTDQEYCTGGLNVVSDWCRMSPKL